ncbi:MAG: hypothetical protein ACMUJM_21705 [bacterium]
MNFKRSLSLIMIFIFSFIFCIAFSMNQVRAQERTAYQTCIDGGCETDAYGIENELSTLFTSTTEPSRFANWFQRDTQTSAWGGTVTQYAYGPDAGFGETARGFQYTDPLTGASVSYQVTGIGMGMIPLPMYGGMNSALAAASYGPYAYGNQPVTQPTLGFDTQTSEAGNAFGQGYQFSVSRPNLTAMVGTSLLQNPLTMGSGLALAAMSGAFGNYGYTGAVSSPLAYTGAGYGYPSYGYGGYGYPSYGYSGYGASAAYGYPGYGYSGGYNTGYSAPYGYSGYAPSYGGSNYTGAGTYSRYY